MFGVHYLEKEYRYSFFFSIEDTTLLQSSSTPRIDIQFQIASVLSLPIRIALSYVSSFNLFPVASFIGVLLPHSASL